MCTPSCEIRKVELDLVPALVKTHRHCADEGLHPCGALVIACTEASPHVLVVQYLNFECEVFLMVEWWL